jgi:hypothetical protein
MKTGLIRLFGGAIVMLLAMVALAMVAVPSAKAVPITPSEIPDARYTNQVGGGIINTSDSQGQSSILPTTGLSVSGSGQGLQGPTLYNASTSNDYTVPSISAFALANAGATATAHSALEYFVAFSGADGTVPINVQASGGVESTGGRAFLRFDLQLVENGVDAIFENLDITGGSQLFSLDQTYQLTANVLYRVIMDTQVFSQGSGGAANSHLDPFFSAPAGYTVLTSTGVGNASPVAATPIPAALPLFTSALGGLGLLGWRRKKAARAA